MFASRVLRNGAPARQLSRQVTEDGRQSLKKHLFGKREGGGVGDVVAKNVGRKELIPLFVCVGAGVLVGGWFAQVSLCVGGTLPLKGLVVGN